jgi:hypothetical protein
VDDDPARVVRKLVLSLLLAVARITVNGRPAKTASWKPDRGEPEVLDLFLASLVVGKEIASQPKSFRAYVKKVSDELDKESGHRWVRVREHDFVPISGSLSPIQHAAADVPVVPSSRPPPTLLLSRSPSRPGFRNHGRARQTLTLVQAIPRL